MERDVLRMLLEHVRSRRFGKYRGTVVDNSDPKKKGRLKVSAPAVLPPSVSVWAMPCVPYAGPKVGLFALPPVGAGVWVEFEGGDLSFPVWVGCFWADDEAPASEASTKILKTESLSLKLDDDAGTATLGPDEGASLELSDDAVMSADSSKLTVASDGVTAEAGSHKIEVTSASVSVNSGALEVM